MSEIILALAQHVLAQPTERSSREAISAALLLANVAWNRTVDPAGGDRSGHYRKVLRALKKENPKCLRELKSAEVEELIRELERLKEAHYPLDNRIIVLCGITATNNIRVESYQLGVGNRN